ncbi:hypothetical protein [Bacillus sp. FSL K6-3431]|uniref:hypothetical protein n=1 Tax=Bacillus sp. FSL K6-3431 TaxID=2921500 RepID=UPI0030F4CDE8
MREYISILFNDASFVGSLFGALLSGLIAIIILIIQIRKQEKRLKDDINKSFLKTFSTFSTHIKLIIDELDSLISNDTIRIKLANTLTVLNHIDDTLGIIKDVNVETIPYKYYSDFLILKESLFNLSFDYQELTLILKSEGSINKDSIDDYSNIIEVKKNIINSYYRISAECIKLDKKYK